MTLRNLPRLRIGTLSPAALAVPALLVALLIAAAVTANNTRAQGAGSADDYPNLSTYDNPQPCGPGAGDASMEEPHEITSGHYALFDAYWRTTSNGERDIDVAGVGVLHTNLCPPEMVATTTKVKRKTVTTTIRQNRDGGMDIEEAIIHVLNTHLATTTLATSTSDGQFSLAEYPDVAPLVSAGDTVWWLRLDDPDTTNVDETSDLGIGFSTLLLDEKHWDSPMRYRIEVERHPTNPGDVPHFFAYEAPKPGNAAHEDPVWDSASPGEGVMELGPSEYKELQWVFTEPGTYLLWVHLLGDVRQDNPHDSADADYDPNWNAISSNDTETSEVYRRYTFHVGPLTLNHNPAFGIVRSVPENSAPGTAVGSPVRVIEPDSGDTLSFGLVGDGARKFAVSAVEGGAQISVANGVVLNYEDASSYDLKLTVSDGKDRFSNVDAWVDDAIPVLIEVVDDPNEQLAITLEADRTTQTLGQGVRLTARIHNSPVASDRLSYRYHEQNVGGGDSRTGSTRYLNRTVTWNRAPVSREYTMTVWVTALGANGPQATSDKVVIAWTN